VNRSGQETEGDMTKDISSDPSGSGFDASNEAPNDVGTAKGHSYYLRSRAEPTSDTT
jgi:hypothetical protein